MTVIELTEHGRGRSLPLDDATGRALADSRLVEARPDPSRRGQWRVRARTRVGVAAVTVPGGRTVTLRITPKIPVARLFFLLGYSLDPKG